LLLRIDLAAVGHERDVAEIRGVILRVVEPPEHLPTGRYVLFGSNLRVFRRLKKSALPLATAQSPAWCVAGASRGAAHREAHRHDAVFVDGKRRFTSATA
jgi:hypothetical protein